MWVAPGDRRFSATGLRATTRRRVWGIPWVIRRPAKCPDRGCPTIGRAMGPTADTWHGYRPSCHELSFHGADCNQPIAVRMENRGSNKFSRTPQHSAIYGKGAGC